MRLFYIILLCSFAILSSALIIYPNLPKFLSFQDKIDPTTLISEYDPLATSAIFNNSRIDIPNFQINSPQVLGLTNSSNKRIEVDLTTQTIYAFENNQQLYSFKVSSGTWNRTPTGTFYIWSKIRSQKMSGGSKSLGTYYYLPNVPYILFFYNETTKKHLGYSIHGAYWHNNFGVPMSHGCINMKIPEAKSIFEWADMDTPIIIYGKYQKP